MKRRDNRNSDEWGYALALTRSAEDISASKASRTRLRLLAALAERLNRGGDPSGIRVADITADADVAHGTFYRYFSDQEAAFEELLGGFLSFLADSQALAREGEPGSPERIRQSVATYARVFRANTGLMRRLMSTDARGGASRERFHAFNREWYLRVAEAMSVRRKKRKGSSAAALANLLPIAYALGGMVDEFLAQIYIRQDSNLEFLANDIDAIADHLTQAWCFGAYGDVATDELEQPVRVARRGGR